MRLCGQDSQRGTFSQRHAVLVDQTNQNEYIPLNNIAPGQARFEISTARCYPRRPCSASSTATASPIRNTLVLWEAQFGDFANGAQVIIDQFIGSRRDQVAAHERPGDAAAARL